MGRARVYRVKRRPRRSGTEPVTEQPARGAYAQGMRVAVAAAAVFALLFGASASTGASTTRKDRAASLRVSARPTPVLMLRCLYATNGSYPQFSGGDVDLRAVNTAVRRAVVRAEPHAAPPGCPKHPLARGIFQTELDKTLISASTAVVSALIPTLDIPPGGNDGETWIAVTARVPSGQVVGFRDLLAPGARALSKTADTIRRQAVRESACVKNALSPSNPSAKDFAAGFAPSYSESFALTAHGLVVGFANGEVTGPACGRVAITVPYRLVAPYLSAGGRRLIAEVRPPMP